MLRVLAASVLLSLSAEAAHLDTVCKSAITNPPLFTDGLVSRISYDGRNVVETMDGKEIFETPERIFSLIKKDDRIWALTYSQVLELDLEGTIVHTHAIDMNRTMFFAGDVLIVIRSGGTVTALDTKADKVIWNSFMADIKGGEAITGAFDGKNIQMAFATSREGGFTGVVSMAPSTGTILKTIPYESRKYGVIAPDAIAHWNNGNLILNNGGWIHEITGKQIASGKSLKPRWIAQPIPNEVNPHYMILRGDFFFEGTKLVGCGSFRELTTTNEWTLKSALFRVEMK